MGNGAAKKNKQSIQPKPPTPPSAQKNVVENQSVFQPTQRPTSFSPVDGSPDSARRRASPELVSPPLANSRQASAQKSIRNLPNMNGNNSSHLNGHNSPLLNGNDGNRDADLNNPLSPDDSLGEKPNSHRSSRNNGFIHPGPIDRTLSDSESLNDTHKNDHQRHASTSHGHASSSHGHTSSSRGHAHDYCTHCPHCVRNAQRERTKPSTPAPKWLTEKPGTETVHIDMDKYDIDAVNDKTVSENGHLHGSYDYRPQLTIEQPNDYDSSKETYYTQPFVAKTMPNVSPTRTPFPEYNVLQRKERRINKPYTLSLFAD